MKWIRILPLLLILACGPGTDSPPGQNEVDARSDHTDEVSVNGIYHSEDTVQTQSDVRNANRVSDAQQRLQDRQRTADLGSAVDSDRRYRMQAEPYNAFNDQDGYLQLVGVTVDRLDEVLGEPPVLVRQSVEGAPVRREVRVYMPYEKDSTGLYIYIRNEEVVSFRLDTFMGLANSSVLEFFN